MAFDMKGQIAYIRCDPHQRQLCADSLLCKVKRTALSCHSPPPRDAAVRPAEAAIGAWCSIMSTEASLCGQTRLLLAQLSPTQKTLAAAACLSLLHSSSGTVAAFFLKEFCSSQA
jgi:hypothetical protein